MASGAQPGDPVANGDAARTYFASYMDMSVHELMLKDAPRTMAYKEFFEENSDAIKDKTVMDVGAGTGILSLFAASVGAKKVYAVEASNMATLCKEIIKCNGFEETVEVHNCPVEELNLPEGTKVDIIVSEWMGFYLLHESMLDSVIFARNKYLSKHGLVVPSRACLFVAPTDMESYYSCHIDYWKNVYGFDFSPAIPAVTQKFKKEPVIAEVGESELLAKPQKVIELDLMKVQSVDVSKVSNTLNFKMEVEGTLRGFVSWFDVEFSPLINSEASVITLSSAPGVAVTHWKQTLFVLPEDITVDVGDEISSLVELSQSEDNKRHYNISIELLDIEDDYSTEEDHPVPCDCGAPKCRLITAIMDTYAEEHRELEEEADIMSTKAETEAVHVMDAELSLEQSDLDIADK